MVLIKNLTQTQVNGIADNYKGEVITNADSNKLMFNNGTEFTYLVYSDLNNVISGLAGISATNLTGTLQTAAQPNVTSLGTLTGLTVNNNLVVAQHNGVDKGLTLGGALVTSSADQLNYVNTTPGTAEANKALVTDSNNSIVGLTNLETDNLTVNGTLVTSSAIELNYVDVNTLGVAQASKALVVDADRNITNINTLEADFIQVNGTLVTSSAIELNYVDVETLGTAQASKSLVVDADRNISNLNNLSAVNLTGTLQTAAQPNVTSVGTLEGLTVTGTTNLESLSVNGVPLDAFKLGGLKLRVYSTPDFTGRVIKADIIDTVNFINYEPVTGTTTNYSLEAWGYIKPLYTESYTFTVSSNDRFRLWINNQLVRTEWTDGDDNNLQTSPIALTAGNWYSVYIQHAQYTGTEKLSLLWSSPTQTSELVPAGAMAYDDKMLTVNSHESFVQDKFTLYDSVNTTQTSLAVNSNGDLAIASASSNVNIVGHNGSTAGLRLAGTLVTATATELNYNDTTVGTGASVKAVILDSNRDFAGIRNLTTDGLLGINTLTPDKQVEINSATGEALRLTYNDSSNYADFDVSSSGILTVNTSGAKIHLNDNVNVADHDGAEVGLQLAGVLVTSTAAELNYVDTTQGTAEASKALVLDASRNLTNVNNLSLTGYLATALVTDSTSTTTGSITTAGGVGIAKNLNVGAAATVATTLSVGTDLTVSGTLGVTGAATLSDALSVSGTITNSNVTQSTSTITGALVTSGGAGIAKNLNVGGTVTVTGDATLSANLSVTGPALVIPVGNTAARPTGAEGQIRYNSETSQFEGFGAGNTWGSLGGVTDVNQDTYISAEDTAGANNDELKFFNNGSESMRLTALGLMGLGTSSPAKKLEINSATGDVLRLTYNDNNGSAANYADFDISATGILTVNTSGAKINLNDNVNVADHDGSTTGLQLAGVLVTSTAAELNYVDTTPGTAEASKALVLNGDRNLTNVNALTATTLNATTVNATNVKTTGNVGINTSDLSFGLQVNEATGNVLRLVYNDSDGSASSSADFTIDNASNLSINAAGSVNIATHNGSSTGLKLAGVLVTSTAAELNYVDTTPGTAEASKALVVNANRDITNINSISMNSLNLTFDNATGNSVGAPLVITRTTSATPANGLGVGMTYKLENSANANIEFGNTQVVATDITTASEDGNFVVNLMTNGALVESMRLSSTTMYVNELYETSDRRVKENFVNANLSETHARVLKLKLTDYNYIGNEKTHRGLIAQEVEEIIPVAIETANRNGISDFKSVSNREITNHLVGSVQYLSQKLEEALAKIAELESRL